MMCFAVRHPVKGAFLDVVPKVHTTYPPIDSCTLHFRVPLGYGQVSDEQCCEVL